MTPILLKIKQNNQKLKINFEKKLINTKILKISKMIIQPQLKKLLIVLELLVKKII